MAKNRESFILELTEVLKTNPTLLSESALAYFESLKTEKTDKTTLTENGIKILKFMQENWEKRNNLFKASDIAEGLFTSGRSVSGSMKKLVSDGYVVKEGKDPVIYSLTEETKSLSLT